MKNKIQVAITILIALSLALGMLTGCKSNSTLNKYTTKNINTTEYSAIRTASPQPTRKPIDLNGRTIKIYDPQIHGGSNFINEGHKTPIYEYVLQQYEGERIIKIEKEFNCNIQAVDGENYKSADIFLSGVPELLNFDGRDVQFIPFMSLEKYSNILDLNNSILWNVKKQKSAAYGQDRLAVFPQYDYSNFFADKVMFFNKSMLERAGLWDKYNLYDMQKNKTWNWDVFKKLCQEISKKDDQIGLLYAEGTIDSFILSNSNGQEDSSFIALDNNNKIVINAKKPAQRAALDLLLGLSSSHCLNAITSTVPGTKYNCDAFHSYNLFVDCKGLFFIAEGNTVSSLEKMQDEWGVVALPMGPNSKNYYTSSNFTECYGINKNSSNPEELAYILKELAPVAIPSDDLKKIIGDRFARGEDGFDTRISETYNLLSQEEAVVNKFWYPFLGDKDDAFDLYAACMFDGQHTLSGFLNSAIPSYQSALNKEWTRVIRAIKKNNSPQ